MDLVAAINRISELAVAAKRPELAIINDIQGEADDVFHTIAADGTIARHIIPPHPRRYLFGTIEDFIAAVARLTPPGKSPTIFCGATHGISAILDEPGDRRDRLTMPLKYSAEFATLLQLASERKPMDQKRFLRLLRIDLAGAVSSDIVSIFRDLKFQQAADGESNISTGKETVGRRVKSEIVGGGSGIPETVAICPFVYDRVSDERFRSYVKCAIDVNLDDQTFTMIPLSGELQRAQQATDRAIQTQIAELLKTAETPAGGPLADFQVFIGTP